MLRKIRIVAALTRLALTGAGRLRAAGRPITVTGLLEEYRSRPNRPQPCTRPAHEPSCSEYALNAVRRRGSVVGTVLAVSYTLACSEWE